MLDWSTLDGHALADLVRRRVLSPRELIRSAIERIERVDSKVNSVPIRCFEAALEYAESVESGADSSAEFQGVPFLMKDLGPACAGTENTVGSKFLSGYSANYDGELTRRFRRAGFVVVGKSNTAEFGALPTTEPAHWGATRNPWDLDRTAGGSSGGAAAAVAAGLVPVAHANDAGGSIRIPASCCGVFGIKPTRARTPMGPAVGDLMNGLASEFVVSRSVRDSALVLDLVNGPDLGDPYCAPPKTESYRDVCTRDPRDPLRVGIDGLALERGDGETAAAVRDAAALCEQLGHTVEVVRPPVSFRDIRDEFTIVWCAGVSSAIESHARLTGRHPRSDSFEPLTWWLYQRGHSISASTYLMTISALQRAARQLARFHEDYDVVLGPVTSSVAPCLGYFHEGSPESQLERALEYVLDSPLANLTGQPAMSVPLYWASGLPVGVQFTARFGDEATLFGLAGQLERARSWVGRLPPIAQ